MTTRYRSAFLFTTLLAAFGTAMAGEAASAQARAAADQRCQPEWPAKSEQNRESGSVALMVLVGADGKVRDAKITQSSGSRDLDKATLVAASKCTFVPAVTDGVAVASWFGLRQQWIAGARPTAFPQ